MDDLVFATVRLGKSSVDAIKFIDGLPLGKIHDDRSIKVVCTQVTNDLKRGAFAFIWLGSDNSKGSPTSWKQGFKAVGSVDNIIRGAKYNDPTTITLKLLYVFSRTVTRLDILKYAPEAYYWCSSLPIIGLDDHSNQTVRVINREAELSDIAAFFYCLNSVDTEFEVNMLDIDTRLKPYFQYVMKSPVQVNSVAEEQISYEVNISTKLPRNRIIFGAPGTGKSFQLEDDRITKLGVPDSDYERVTFYPDYTYSQFVGAYKPVSDEKGLIQYTFVPGPFMRIYSKALKNAQTDRVKPYLLIIEEINRARPASVFGDIFQLLDRNENDISEYSIQIAEEKKRYLANELKCSAAMLSKIKLPNNLFIWATMNSADQGVYPMDTAFKRRWNFEYIGINKNENKISCNVNLVEGNSENNISWNRLRKAINAKLLDTCRVNEDKLLGPFFLSKKVIKADKMGHIIDEEAFRKAFKSKVIMYLFEDAARQYRSRLFKSDICKMYSSICDEFDKHGMAIFGDDFKSAYYDQQKD
ncbi:AAA family ATPase [Megasphaera stantonii]|uniref:AAA family ATPase n=1 Tax=Megasphaera stantonii TaxID=2144175 RepID=UPI002941F6C7|nr:AAA family ATPase [Megasphaera stantonii]